jgi:deoxyguanosine kinase
MRSSASRRRCVPARDARAGRAQRLQWRACGGAAAGTGKGFTVAAQTDLGYIVVEGPIGVGKTTLARRLAASLGGETLLEAPQDNPFLPRFYDNPRAHALSTQLFFLLQRAQQMRELAQGDMFARVRVADFMMEKDRLFAELTLDEHELSLYERVFAQLVRDVPTPDLVIYLQAPVDVLLERVANRGVPYEDSLDARYLQRLAAAYTRYFFHYEAAPLVIVNAAEINLAHGDRDYNLLFEQIQTIRKGRHYLNPLPF